jgi:hypothetical protein
MEELKAARRYLNQDWSGEDEERIRELSKLDVAEKLGEEVLDGSSETVIAEEIIEDIVDGRDTTDTVQLKKAYKESRKQKGGLAQNIEESRVRMESEIDYIAESLDTGKGTYRSLSFELSGATVTLESETEETVLSGF